MQTLDGSTIAYIVMALIPNLLLILWAMARMSHQIRFLTAELESVKREMQLVDEGVKQVSDSLGQGARVAESSPIALAPAPERLAG